MRSEYADLLKQAEKVTVVYDNCGSHNLRCVPYFLELGFRSFSYPWSWRTISQKPVRVYYYDYFLSSRIPIADIPDPLVIIASQAWEQKYSFNSISNMINKALNVNSKVIVVCDTQDFELWGSHRPLIEEDFVRERLLRYRDLYVEFCKVHSHSFSFPLRDSMNIFLQKCAEMIRIDRGIKCKTIRELHAHLLHSPENPLWWFWSNMLKSTSEFTIPVLVRESGLLGFVLKRIELSQRNIEWFVHKLRGPAERFLNPNLRNIKPDQIQQGRMETEKTMQIVKRYGLENDSIRF